MHDRLKQELRSLFPPGLSFRDPQLLLLLLARAAGHRPPGLRERRGDGALSVPTLAFVAAARPTWRVRLRHMPFALGCLGYAGLVVALARPRVGLERTESWTEGVDVVVALDASGSMAAEDFKPKNRFYVARTAARQFVEGRPSDRLGLLTFAGRSRTVVPLTTDRAMLLERLAFAEARGAGRRDRDRHGARERPRAAPAVEGEVEGGRPRDRRREQRRGDRPRHGRRDREGARRPRLHRRRRDGDRGPWRSPSPCATPRPGRSSSGASWPNVDVDEKLLQRIATRRAGASSAPPTRRASPTRSHAIDQLEKSRIKTATYTRWSEIYPRDAPSLRPRPGGGGPPRRLRLPGDPEMKGVPLLPVRRAASGSPATAAAALRRSSSRSGGLRARREGRRYGRPRLALLSRPAARPPPRASPGRPRARRPGRRRASPGPAALGEDDRDGGTPRRRRRGRPRHLRLDGRHRRLPVALRPRPPGGDVAPRAARGRPARPGRLRGEAQVLVPLTLDTAAVGLFLDALEPGIGALPGTSLSAGLAAQPSCCRRAVQGARRSSSSRTARTSTAGWTPPSRR